MNRDFVLSAIAAAVLHGGLFFGMQRGAPPPAASKPDVPPVVMVVPKLAVEEEPVPTREPSDKPSKEAPEAPPPQLPNVVSIATDKDFTMKYVPAPEVDTTGMTTIPTRFGNMTSGMNVGGVFRLTELDRIPKTRFQMSPVYPFEAKQRGMTGTVQIEFTVDENGRVSDPRIIDTPDRMFNEPTIAAVLKWRFEPGVRHGKPVRFRMIAPVVFNLND